MYDYILKRKRRWLLNRLSRWITVVSSWHQTNKLTYISLNISCRVNLESSVERKKKRKLNHAGSQFQGISQYIKHRASTIFVLRSKVHAWAWRRRRPCNESFHFRPSQLKHASAPSSLVCSWCYIYVHRSNIFFVRKKNKYYIFSPNYFMLQTKTFTNICASFTPYDEHTNLHKFEHADLEIDRHWRRTHDDISMKEILLSNSEIDLEKETRINKCQFR